MTKGKERGREKGEKEERGGGEKEEEGKSPGAFGTGGHGT